MVEVITAVVDTQTNEFCPYGHELDARYICVTVPHNPDPVKEKYSGNPADPIAAKTPAEQAAWAAAQKEDDATHCYDCNKLLKAKAISDLAFRLGKPPGQLTTQEIAAERTRITNIYKAL